MTRRMMAGAVLVPALAAGAGVALAEPAGAETERHRRPAATATSTATAGTDRAVLSSRPDERCAVTVQLGLTGSASFGAAERPYTYPAPDTGLASAPTWA